MPRCELTGKGPVVKNLVSHSNIKTKSRAHPNIQQKRIFSPMLNQLVRLKVAASTIRDFEHSGGFDAFVLRSDDKKMSKRARAIKSQMLRKLRAKPSSAAPAKEA